jgi:hypothetical protein
MGAAVGSPYFWVLHGTVTLKTFAITTGTPFLEVKSASNPSTMRVPNMRTFHAVHGGRGATDLLRHTKFQRHAIRDYEGSLDASEPSASLVAECNLRVL